MTEGMQITVNIVGADGPERLRFADALYKWTDDGTLKIIGRPINGPLASHETTFEIEYPKDRVVSVERKF